MIRGLPPNARVGSDCPSPLENRGGGDIDIYPGTREPKGSSLETAISDIRPREALLLDKAFKLIVRNQGALFRVHARYNGGRYSW